MPKGDFIKCLLSNRAEDDHIHAAEALRKFKCSARAQLRYLVIPYRESFGGYNVAPCIIDAHTFFRGAVVQFHLNQSRIGVW